MCRIQCLGVLRQGWCRADLFLLLKITPTTIAGPFFHPPLPQTVAILDILGYDASKVGKGAALGY